MHYCLNNTECTEREIMTLGKLPLGNPAQHAPHGKTWKEDFSLIRCDTCGSIQTKIKVPSNLLADESFYSSGSTVSIIENYRLLIDGLRAHHGISKASTILEIGCGDGILLDMLHEQGFTNLTGVEPNDFHREHSFQMIQDFFTPSVIEQLQKTNTVPDLIILNSVIETIPDFESFFSNLSGFMKDGSLLFIEVPYFLSHIREKRVDAFSHLTSNWLTALSMNSMCKKFKFEMEEFKIDDDYRGGSIKMMLKKVGSADISHDPSFLQALEKEREEFPPEFFLEFGKEITSLKKRIQSSITSLMSQGYEIVCYGGGLKASTMVNWLEMDSDIIKRAIDNDGHKHGKYISGTKIPIQSTDHISKTRKTAVIVFALNYLDEVSAFLRKNLSPESIILIPLPEPREIRIDQKASRPDHDKNTRKTSVLIAGIAGASLGTEIYKSLLLAGKYTVYGCDISPLASGLYMDGFTQTFVVSEENYIEDVMHICKDKNIEIIIPGSEGSMVLLSKESEKMKDAGVRLAINTPDIVQRFSNKKTTFELLQEQGFNVPLTREVTAPSDLDLFSFPCIVKPYLHTGGSKSVFIAADKEECWAHITLLKNEGVQVIVQEYIPIDEGEFTISVLSLSNTKVVDAVVMKRIFNSKLSISLKNSIGIVSSGYSQGLIEDFPDLKKQAIRIAKANNSAGPLNIQGRVKNGVLLPFEINPRFSASTYLRALAGFNEIDFYLQHMIHGTTNFPYTLQEGYYLRSFEELFIPKKELLTPL